MRTIKSILTCDTKNLIHMIQCNRCTLQYIGKTKRRLKIRFNEHWYTIYNPNTKSKPTTAAEHFLSSPNHTANDIQLISIEKILSNQDSIRKANFKRHLYLMACYVNILLNIKYSNVNFTSLYLKKAGLASRNIVHLKSFTCVASVFASILHFYLLNRLDH